MSPAEREDQVEHAVLMLLLDHHPAHLTEEDIVHEIADDPDTFGDRDEVLVAIRGLTRAQLVHRAGKFFFATYPAARFAGLSRSD